jgi:ribosomal protein L16/L10AE
MCRIVAKSGHLWVRIYASQVLKLKKQYPRILACRPPNQLLLSRIDPSPV